MAFSSLGAFNFVSMHRPEGTGAPPALLALQLETMQRPGVNGTAFRRTGIKQDPFVVITFADAPSFVAASNLGAAYHTIQGTGPYNLTWAGYDWSGAYNVQFVPLKVEVQAIRRCVGIGGLNLVSLAYIECAWTLQTVFPTA